MRFCNFYCQCQINCSLSYNSVSQTVCRNPKLDDLEFDTEKECPYADRVMQEKRQRLRSTYFKILEYYKNTQKIDQWKGRDLCMSHTV